MKKILLLMTLGLFVNIFLAQNTNTTKEKSCNKSSEKTTCFENKKGDTYFAKTEKTW